MKKLSRVLVLLSGVLIFTGCKKDTKDPIDEFSDLFKNTEWTGETKYSNKPVNEPFSIEFFGNGTFKWHEYFGDFDGTYTINAQDREIKLHFTLSNGIVTATVTQDNKFSNIISPNILSCELNSSGKQNLDNTSWIGKFDVVYQLTLKFKSGQNLSFTSYNSFDASYSRFEGPYERIGAAVRFSILDTSYTSYHHDFFSVVQPDNKIIKSLYAHGPSSSDPAGYASYELTKQ